MGCFFWQGFLFFPNCYQVVIRLIFGFWQSFEKAMGCFFWQGFGFFAN
jgi:hypothetical protein